MTHDSCETQVAQRSIDGSGGEQGRRRRAAAEMAMDPAHTPEGYKTAATATDFPRIFAPCSYQAPAGSFWPLILYTA